MSNKQDKPRKFELYTKVVEVIKKNITLIILAIVLCSTITKGYAIESLKIGDIEIKLTK